MSRYPPVILIHGAFSRPAHWDTWTQSLTDAGFACTAPALPGHEPPDADALSRLTLEDYLAALEPVRAAPSQPPILVGHSMGGLLAQQLAARGTCAAVVCLASAPPFALPAQLRALPYLAPLLPRILSGRTIQPSDAAFRYLALNDLPPEEQRELVGTLGAESGLAYRAMIFGTGRVHGSISAPMLCVSGRQDRIVSARVAMAIAARYGAQHKVFENRGHWLLSRFGHEELAAFVLAWLRDTLRVRG